MILTLLIVLGALLILLWIGSMYFSWKVSEGAVYTPLHTAGIEQTYEKLARLVRRGSYQALWYAKKVVTFIGTNIRGVFFRIFPAARRAFTPRDEMTGLTKGPSSYFLHSLSEEEKHKAPARRNKKVV